MKTIKLIDNVEKLLDMNDLEIKLKYTYWDKGDCSEVGIVKILLFQTIKKHIEENGEYYDRKYDNLFNILDKET